MRMLYRVPGPHMLDGVLCEYCLVPDTSHAIADAQRDGWYRSPALALASIQSTDDAPDVADVTDDSPDPSEQTRDDLLTIARELGIKVDGRWSDDRLRKEVGL